MVSTSGHGCGMSVSMHCTEDAIEVVTHGLLPSGSHPVTVLSCGQQVTLFVRLDQVEQLAAALTSYVQDQQRQAAEAAGVMDVDQAQVL